MPSNLPSISDLSKSTADTTKAVASMMTEHGGYQNLFPHNNPPPFGAKSGRNSSTGSSKTGSTSQNSGSPSTTQNSGSPSQSTEDNSGKPESDDEKTVKEVSDRVNDPASPYN
ncbi:uncharacterized protein I206_105254 [Kwoniella pini CBS 10737]|uniref:Uncharacterized protein n=1 Tax=Kwoniella pini CBS 10737 TaxID=1296096 RepID=A0A1B9I4R4_9TREE|nr:uncharacterized protein I206_03837 [Kwoniella pini CBS 10737]OCF50513.1 hypothetical protein I206_03837 [Kwoniella pini CBS 10737]